MVPVADGAAAIGGWDGVADTATVAPDETWIPPPTPLEPPNWVAFGVLHDETLYLDRDFRADGEQLRCTG